MEITEWLGDGLIYFFTEIPLIRDAMAAFLAIVLIGTAAPLRNIMRTSSGQLKSYPELEFGQIFSDSRDLKHLWTVRDLCGQTAPPPSGLIIFFVRPDFATETRGLATATAGFRASVAEFRGRIIPSFTQGAWLSGLNLRKNAKFSLAF
ncbi:hypothetical protein [Croceibacterium aestuarii]|uniref:hypothetical protein n=1 Tax=Croceibacterium aestuarii TaxID=3064139 RepID=UPI00272EDB39|nr:hypothetical protein [Croceibacterium sp. D39]